jgi:hypothetical protein
MINNEKELWREMPLITYAFDFLNIATDFMLQYVV